MTGRERAGLALGLLLIALGIALMICTITVVSTRH